MGNGSADSCNSRLSGSRPYRGCRHTGLPSSPVNVTSIAIAPKLPSTIYARTISPVGTATLFKSTDGGGAWNGASNGLGNSYVIVLAIDPVSPSKLYAATPAGIFKSTDGAGSWNLLDTGIPTNSFISSVMIAPPIRPMFIRLLRFPGTTDPPCRRW